MVAPFIGPTATWGLFLFNKAPCFWLMGCWGCGQRDSVVHQIHSPFLSEEPNGQDSVSGRSGGQHGFETGQCRAVSEGSSVVRLRRRRTTYNASNFWLSPNNAKRWRLLLSLYPGGAPPVG